MVKFLIATAFLALGACVTHDAPTGPSFVWQCDGASFSARNTEGGNAEVTAGGKVYRLPGVIAASGVRYFDGHVEYWEHGKEALLNVAAGGPYENCHS